MEAAFDIIEGLLILAGTAFVALAAFGVVRLPDLYTRMHSASKGGSVGAGMVLLALAMNSSSTPETLRAIAAIAFFLLTAPISAHLLAKASYTVGYRLWPQSVLDEMPEMPSPQNAQGDASGTALTVPREGSLARQVPKTQRRRPAMRWSEMRRS